MTYPLHVAVEAAALDVRAAARRYHAILPRSTEYYHPDGQPMLAPYSLVTGDLIDLFAPDFAHVPLHEFVYALSIGLANTCRYGGQVHRGYSVARHCILGARLLGAEKGWGSYVFFPELLPFVRDQVALHFLLHDASEGMGLGDMVYPLKQLLRPIYGPLEDLMMAAIYRRLGLSQEPQLEPYVKQLDTHMLHDEQAGLRGCAVPADHVAYYRQLEIPGDCSANRSAVAWRQALRFAYRACGNSNELIDPPLENP